jgi:hypothetical protein
MPFSDEALEKLRSELPRRAAIELAGELGMKPGSVRNILSGRANNDAVVIAALEKARVYQEKLKDAQDALA